MDRMQKTDADRGRWTDSQTFSRVGMAVTVLVAVRFLFQLLLELFFTGCFPAAMQAWWYPWMQSFLPLYGAGVPAMYAVLRTVPVSPVNACYVARLPDGAREERKSPPFGVGAMVVVAVMALGYMYAGGWIGEGIMSLLSKWMQYDYRNGLESLVSQSSLWMVLVGTVVAAPIGEELVFRKWLMDRTRRFGDGTAILLSALIFALFHGNFYQLFYVFPLALLLGYAYARTGKIGVSIGLHMLINFVGSMLPMLLQTVPASAMPTVARMYQWWTCGLMLAAAVLTPLLLNRLRLGQGEITLPRGHRLRTVMGEGGMALALGIEGVFLFLSLWPVR